MKSYKLILRPTHSRGDIKVSPAAQSCLAPGQGYGLAVPAGGTLAVLCLATGGLREVELGAEWSMWAVLEIVNPVYSPGSSGVPYANAKGIGYPGKQVKFCFIIEL